MPNQQVSLRQSASSNLEYLTITKEYKLYLQFLNENKKNYMLTYLSIRLVKNLLELFTILTECGRNGKSKLIIKILMFK